MFENKRIAVLGAGRLGEALITGMLDAGIVTKDQFIATAAHAERLTHIRTSSGSRLRYRTARRCVNPSWRSFV